MTTRKEGSQEVYIRLSSGIKLIAEKLQKKNSTILNKEKQVVCCPGRFLVKYVTVSPSVSKS
jgi:hypothetical protein